ncbi:hypothetical protein D3C75_951720 [compost metagenome]
MTDSIARRRWRLILGAEAEAALAENGAGVLDDGDRRRDAALEYLYGREFEGRERAGEDMDRYGGIGRPDPGAVRWLGEVRKLFPRSVAEVLQRDALDRYRMSSLLADPQVLAQAKPSIELVQTLMAVRERLPTAVHTEALRLIRRVVEQLRRGWRRACAPPSPRGASATVAAGGRAWPISTGRAPCATTCPTINLRAIS